MAHDSVEPSVATQLLTWFRQIDVAPEPWRGLIVELLRMLLEARRAKNRPRPLPGEEP